MTCETCEGSGEVLVTRCPPGRPEWAADEIEPCPDCDGTGEVDE